MLRGSIFFLEINEMMFEMKADALGDLISLRLKPWQGG